MCALLPLVIVRIRAPALTVNDSEMQPAIPAPAAAHSLPMPCSPAPKALVRCHICPLLRDFVQACTRQQVRAVKTYHLRQRRPTAAPVLRLPPSAAAGAGALLAPPAVCAATPFNPSLCRFAKH